MQGLSGNWDLDFCIHHGWDYSEFAGAGAQKELGLTIVRNVSEHKLVLLSYSFSLLSSRNILHLGCVEASQSQGGGCLALYIL